METSPRAAALCNHTASPTVWCGHLFGTPKFWGPSGYGDRFPWLFGWGQTWNLKCQPPQAELKKFSDPAGHCQDVLTASETPAKVGKVHFTVCGGTTPRGTPPRAFLSWGCGQAFCLFQRSSRLHYRSGQISGSLGIRLALAPLMQCTPGKFQPGPSWERSYQTTEENNSCKKVSL